MLKIIACYKWVIDEADIKVDQKTRELIKDRVGYKISDYDRNAIEEAVRLKETHGGSVVAVTVGPPWARQSLKDALSRGPDKAWFINDSDFVELDPSQTAAILAQVIKAKGDYDLIICGEGSSDLYAQQVGPALAQRLGIPCATYVNKITIVEGSKKVIAQRKLDDGLETVSVELPLLITVLPDINTPRIPSLKQVLGAAKKPVEEIKKSELGQGYEPKLKTLSIVGAAVKRRQLKYSASAADIKAFADALLKEGAIV